MAFANVEAGLKATTDTQFLIGSVTKSFTFTGLALLMDERRIDWKKPMRDYIPEFRLHDAVATERITVRDLLCHHSGLPRRDWIWMPGDLSPAQMLRYTPPARIGPAGETKDRREHEADKSSDPVERGMDRDVLHTLAIDPDLAAVAQPGANFFLGSDHACLSPNPCLQ